MIWPWAYGWCWVYICDCKWIDDKSTIFATVNRSLSRILVGGVPRLAEYQYTTTTLNISRRFAALFWII